MSSAPGDPAEPAVQSVPARGASHYAKGTAANMVRSLAVILAISLAIFAMSGRGNSRSPESLDVPGTAQHRAEQAGQPFAYPTDLPDGWIATNVRYERSTDGVMAWNAGYTTPDEEYVSVQQAADPETAWITSQTHDGESVGTLTTQDGRAWVKRDREGQVQRSLVHEPAAKGELTTIVTGTGSWKQLEGFANRLVEATPGAKGASAG
ncbi:DUF4245 domain-containing protein [Janibacter sp. GS2]|uniref:DUF4245 domain-containing protein n=1 Tax=Janibacter sp. GS2 TaxID=3442646 RepID=UPI003EBE7030